MADRSVGLLTEDMLERFRTRAPAYDRENKFFQEDFDELKAAGYLKMTVPRELGGMGFSLYDVSQVTRRLAMYAPATALAMNMHHYWVGLAADLWRGGDKSCEWILKEAAAGEVFAAGHAETGNDIPVLLSTCKAERVDGGTNSPAASRSAASRRSGRGLACTEWTRAIPRRRKSSTGSCRAAPPA